MLSDIQIPMNLPRPFHNVFTPCISQRSLEPVLPKRDNRTGGRGNKHKVPKSEGRGKVWNMFHAIFVPIFFAWLSVSGDWWTSGVVEKSVGTREVFSFSWGP